MTPATLRKLEWAGPRMTCLVCDNGFRMRHRPGCELDAAIREAEQGEKGAAAPKVGDVVWLSGFGFREVAFPDEARVETLAYSEICAIPDCDCVFAEAMRAARAATQTTR